MHVQYNELTNEYIVTVNKDDLLIAFMSEYSLNQLMHEICANVYDEQMAEMIFPTKKGGKE